MPCQVPLRFKRTARASFPYQNRLADEGDGSANETEGATVAWQDEERLAATPGAGKPRRTIIQPRARSLGRVMASTCPLCAPYNDDPVLALVVTFCTGGAPA